MTTVKFRGEVLSVHFRKYNVNDRIAIVLEETEELPGAPYGHATVNLDHIYLLDNYVIIDEPNMPGITKALHEAKIIEPTGTKVSSGWNVYAYPIAQLLIEPKFQL